MLSVHVSYGAHNIRFAHDWVVKVIRVVGKQEKIFSGAVGVRFVDNSEIRKLNKKYRHKNKSTDVLSFTTDGPSGSDIGDIIVSVEYVRDMIAGSSDRMRDHVGMLLIHGFLHIIGYDHMNRPDAKKMWEKQDCASNTLGVHRILFDDFG